MFSSHCFSIIFQKRQTISVLLFHIARKTYKSVFSKVGFDVKIFQYVFEYAYATDVKGLKVKSQRSALKP